VLKTEQSLRIHFHYNNLATVYYNGTKHLFGTFADHQYLTKELARATILHIRSCDQTQVEDGTVYVVASGLSND